MLATMLDLHDHRKSILLIIIEKENLERMKKADPITLESVNMGGWLPVPAYPQKFSLLIAYEEDSEELHRRAKGNKQAFLAWLERYRQWKPDVDGVQHIAKLPNQGEEN